MEVWHIKQCEAIIIKLLLAVTSIIVTTVSQKEMEAEELVTKKMQSMTIAIAQMEKEPVVTTTETQKASVSTTGMYHNIILKDCTWDVMKLL